MDSWWWISIEVSTTACHVGTCLSRGFPPLLLYSSPADGLLFLNFYRRRQNPRRSTLEDFDGLSVVRDTGNRGRCGGTVYGNQS